MKLNNLFWVISCTSIFACHLAPPAQLSTEPLAACREITMWRVPDGNIVEPTRFDRRSDDEVFTQARMDGVALSAAYHCLVTGSLADGYDRMTLPKSELGRVNQDCILEHELLADAWGIEIAYVARGDSFEVRSAGPDRLFGTKDDISLPSDDEPFAFRVDVRARCSAIPQR